MKRSVILLLLFGIVLMAYRSLNKTGLDLIKESEALRLDVYLDQAGLPTIGYGHLIKSGEVFTTITEELLRDDVATAENLVNQLVTVELTQNMFNALVSLVFNIGSGNFASSTLLRKLNAGDYEGAQNEFPRWNKITINGVLVVSNGLVARRGREASEFLA